MPARRPDAARARALELLGQGLSEREVVEQLAREGIRVAKGSIGNWKREAASAGPPPEGSPANVDDLVAAIAAGAQKGDEWELPEVDLVHLPAELLERLGRRYARKIADTLDGQIVDHQLLGALLRDHERVCKALVAARPPVAQDPERDPANLAMAEIAINHVRRMIEDARRRRAQGNEPTPPEGTSVP